MNSSWLSSEVIDDPAKCGDGVGVPQVPRVLVRLEFAVLPHATQLIDHFLDSLLALVVSRHAVEDGLETIGSRKCYQPIGRCRPAGSAH
jgi:hypothetical protein